jgi:hypothetical protein
MTTLHVNITLEDEARFRQSFADHSQLRRDSGVQGERVHRVAGADGQLQIELDFATPAEAEAFHRYLRENVWKDNPALVGTPEAVLLEPLVPTPAG